MPQHVLAGLGGNSSAWRGGGGGGRIGRLSPLTQPHCLLATLGFGLCFSSQAFGLPKQEVFELPASLISGTSAVGG